MSIHRNLLPIIFAYTGLSRRYVISIISENIYNQCCSYHYINSFEKSDVIKLFEIGYMHNLMEINIICLKIPYIANSHSLKYNAMIYASTSGYLKLAILLLADPLMNPGYADNYFIQMASRNGHFEIVKFLLADKRINPNCDDNLAIRWASEAKQYDIVRLLLSDPRVCDSLSTDAISRYREFCRKN